MATKRKTLKRVRKALTKYVRSVKNPAKLLPKQWTTAEVRIGPNGRPQIKINPRKLVNRKRKKR